MSNVRRALLCAPGAAPPKKSFAAKRAGRSETYLCAGRPALAHGAPANGEKSLGSNPASLGGCTHGGGHKSRADTNRFDKAQPVQPDRLVSDPGRRSKRYSSVSSETSPRQPAPSRLSGSPKISYLEFETLALQHNTLSNDKPSRQISPSGNDFSEILKVGARN